MTEAAVAQPPPSGPLRRFNTSITILAVGSLVWFPSTFPSRLKPPAATS